LEKLLKTLTRTVVLECYANRCARRALREVESAYKEMLKEMVEYAVRHKASQSTLHKVFYSKFRERYPWLPTRVIKGAYRDAVRRAKSFRELKKRGRAYTDNPEIRRVTITYADSQDWRIEDGVIKLRTHSGWVGLHYRSHKQLPSTSTVSGVSRGAEVQARWQKAAPGSTTGIYKQRSTGMGLMEGLTQRLTMS
jgi:putative transposase